MARNRHNKEFVDFVLTGRNYRFGNLRMEGDVVFSYTTPIALVNRAAKRISFDARYYSATTTQHRNAVLYAQDELMDNFGFVYSNDLP